MIRNLTSLYNQLKPTLNQLNSTIDEIEYINEKSDKSKVLEALLHDIDYHNFLKYNLKNSSYVCCLLVWHKQFSKKIIHIWSFVYTNRKKIILKYGRLFSKKEINYIESKLVDINTINNFSNEDKLRLTKILHIIKKFIPSKEFERFLEFTDNDIKNISFSKTLSIVEWIRKIWLATDKELYSLRKITKEEWKIFLKNVITLEGSVLYNYFVLPEKYENDFDIYYKQESVRLIKQIDKIKTKWEKNELLFQYNILKTYNDIKQTFDIVIHLSPLQLFILKLFYWLDIKSFFWNNIKYIEALYVFHFSHSYKQADKIISLCEKNYYIRYILYSLSALIFLVIWNLISIVGLSMVIYAKKIALFIKDQVFAKLSIKMDLQLPLKIWGILVAIISLFFSPYLDNIEKIFLENPLADMISKSTIKTNNNDSIESITDNKTTENTKQNISIIFTGFQSVNNIEKDLAYLKNYIINTNNNNISKNSSNIYHSSANKRLWFIKLEKNATFYDIVNSYIPEEIQWLDREKLIKQKIRNYVKKNRIYIRQQVSANGYNSWGMGDLYMLRFLPSGFEINLDELIN